MNHIKPENVHKVQNFVRCLLQGLATLPECDRISLLEQAMALEQYAQELRAIAAAQYKREQMECDLPLFVSVERNQAA